MRELLNAFKGYKDEQHELREQARIISYFSYVGHLKPTHKLKITDLYPLENDTSLSSAAKDQSNKEDTYKILEKWNK